MLFFEYGSLKQKQRNHNILFSCKMLGSDVTEPNYTMFNMAGIYPVVIEGGDTAIHGEVYEVSNIRVMQELFKFYGYTGTRGDIKNYFNSVEIETKFGKAIMLVLKPTQVKKRKIIKDGNW